VQEIRQIVIEDILFLGRGPWLNGCDDFFLDLLIGHFGGGCPNYVFMLFYQKFFGGERQSFLFT
jgi:hypothetical protein